ncbi:MAG: hypothetical protein LBL74_01480 [Bacteroidales bacterium]|jgi:outer membrane protein assembly factor BamD (BamD/ComL family)|nr:hypothetical protein [Bacteroidales bacterium]
MRNLALILAVGLLVACGGKHNADNAVSQEANKSELIKTISATEAFTMKSTQSIDANLADSLMNLYDSFAKQYPTDSICLEYLSKAVTIAFNIKDCERALSFLQRIIDDKSNSKYVEWAYFYKGAVYSDVCGDKNKASDAYVFFLDNYPQSQYVKDANVLLNMLKLQNEMDLIRQFEVNNQSDSLLNN